jgi:hypothetical protein
MGGEEFAVLLPSSTLAGAAAVAERLRQLVAQAGAMSKASRSPTRSAPASPPSGQARRSTLDTLIKRADQALYAAKAKGRNRVETWSSPQEKARSTAKPQCQVDKIDAYEALVQFLYRAPIGLVQASLDGAVDMLNPMSSNLLMPLVRDGSWTTCSPCCRRGAAAAPLADAFDPAVRRGLRRLRLPLGAAAAPGAPQGCRSVLLKLDPSA